MTRFFLVILSSFVACTVSLAQKSLKGKVVEAGTNKPIALANVFLSNTSVGTVTGENGEFIISRFPEGRYDLVVSFVGYETYSLSVQSNQLPINLEIVLKPKVTELQEVTVEPYEKNGWERWGKFFLDNFIGTSAFAGDCELLNKEVVRFRFNKKDNVIKAFANDRLVLENRALGYILKYDLTRFEFNFTTRIFYYQGYPLFEEMQTGRKGLEKKWVRNRENAYYGSLMHFMRSLYRNKIPEEQFEVRRLIVLPDAERERVKKIYQGQVTKTVVNNTIIIGRDKSTGNTDSTAYYEKVMRHPEQMDILIDKLLPGDSIAFAIDSVTAGFTFADHLQVIYRPKKTPFEYQGFLPKGVTQMPLTSELYRPTGQTIMVLANGSYFEGSNLLTSGFWGWWEKIGTMLPFEYRPSKKESPNR